MSEISNSIERTSALYEKELSYIAGNIDNDETGFWARTYIRTAVSFFEAELHLQRLELLEYCRKNNHKISPEVTVYLTNKKYELNENGDLNERYLQQNIKSSIKFVFKQFSEIKGYELFRRYEESGWGNLVETLKVRNRITHPKRFDEQIVSKKEVEDCTEAIEWFMKNVINYIRLDTQHLERQIEELQVKHGQSNASSKT